MNSGALWIVIHKVRAPLIVLIATYTIAIIGFLFIDGIDDQGQIYHMNIFDAFYIVTYTATTIGFGEIPYEFTYAQRIWMSMIMYATVMGWFYSLGSLVTLFQNKLLIAKIAENRFLKQIKSINQSFLIVLGYNYTTSEIIKKANKEGVRVVVIEKDEHKINELNLENFTPAVPCLMGDVYDPLALEKAGLNSKYCKAIVSLFTNDDLNLRVAITAKLLNKDVTLAIKSTTKSQSENLKDLGVEIIENPYELIAEQIDMALCNPKMLVLKQWIHGVGTLEDKIIKMPKGKYIVYGYGKSGRDIYKTLASNNIEVVFILPPNEEINVIPDDMRYLFKTTKDKDEKELLLEADILNASAIIARTPSDTLNLSILSSAKKLNTNIVTISRESKMADLSMFENAKIDLVFIPSKVLIEKTTNALIAPYSNKFLDLVKKENDPKLVSDIIDNIVNKIDINPITFGITINKEKAFAVWNSISNKNRVVKLDILGRSRTNWKERNNSVPLILIRGEEKFLLPSWEVELMINDKILFASTKETLDDIKWIAKNIYEFYYVYFGKEKNMFNKIFKGKY